MSTLAIGAFTIDRVVESEGPFAPAAFILPRFDARVVEQQADWLRPDFLDAEDRLVMSFQSHVLRTGRQNILIDACVGDDKERPLRASWHRQRSGWLQALSRAGLQPEQIDMVCCTHLHADHVGWNTCLRDGRWVPTFPRARYLFARREYAHWEAAHQKAVAEGVALPNHGSFADSVLPVVEAGRALWVDDGHEVDHGVWIEAAPGHTPGNVVLHARSGSAHGLFSGDVLHTPVQLADLTWSSRFCDDPVQSAVTRQRLVDAVADTSTILMPAHFPGAIGGRVVTGHGGLRWQRCEPV
jgi:glyoxylase-like metal-dependent hydrolase (beta-lactamase superfamily II)